MPDLNSVPASPHVLALSRRTSSQQMPPPPAPGHAPSTSDASLNILPSNQTAVNTGAPAAASLPSPRLSVASSVVPPAAEPVPTASGPGPIRHPRPLTAAELHQQLEKEQEAVVNRLTRELDLLRQAQNASVVSNTSSTSASASTTGAESSSTIPIIPDGRQHLLSGSGFSIPSQTSGRERRHTRSGSSASTRSIAATTGSTSVVNITAPAPIRPSGATSLSRQNSTQSHSRQSLSSSPARASSFASSHMADAAHAGYFHLRSPPATGGPTSIPSQATPGSGNTEVMSPSIMPATSRYEETAFHRQELDAVKRENDALKRRIRELERLVRDRRASDAGTRPRSESASTAASVNVSTSGPGAGIARPRGERLTSMLSTAGSVGVGVPEDEVRVGESAASAGLGGAGASGQATTQGGQGL
ncbi:hypothetical protein VMCG_03076 [Cytospora schulzeri]|uniref:Uncharacterized protein n=1 Tax=Cytospora schulzeri TaxID=448051 RepID=A0A423WY04_9PEZI|nr:hypothetical protein VMCG_03076 [Valsa malicola]